jgi:hypothetical protein
MLYAVLNGYLDNIISENLSLYEFYFKNWFKNSIFYMPIDSALDSSIMYKELVIFILWEYTNNFINFINDVQ